MTDPENETSPSETLNELLTRAYDAEKGYEIAADSAEQPALKEWFLANSKQRSDFAQSLKKHLADLEVAPDEGTSIEGKFHQAFMKVKAAVVGQNDLALIEECRRGERTAMLDYQAALENKTLRTDSQVTLSKQAEVVLDQLKALDTIEAGLRAA